eukprot:1158610-Pelagomonas_calceolata.AAC.13
MEYSRLAGTVSLRLVCRFWKQLLSFQARWRQGFLHTCTWPALDCAAFSPFLMGLLDAFLQGLSSQ